MEQQAPRARMTRDGHQRSHLVPKREARVALDGAAREDSVADAWNARKTRACRTRKNATLEKKKRGNNWKELTTSKGCAVVTEGRS